MKPHKPNIQCPPNELGYEDYGQYKVLWRTRGWWIGAQLSPGRMPKRGRPGIYELWAQDCISLRDSWTSGVSGLQALG